MPITPEEASKIKGVVDYRELDGDETIPDFSRALIDLDPVKVKLIPSDMAFYGSSGRNDVTIDRGLPNLRGFVKQFSSHGFIRGELVTPTQGDACGRHMLKLDENEQSDNLVACDVISFADEQTIEVLCLLDRWFGIGPGQEGSPFERRRIYLAAGSTSLWAWVWVMKENSEILL